MSLHRLVIDAAAEAPDNVAVTGPTGLIRYGELDERADALAHGLRATGVHRGDRVVVWAGKSPAVVVALQAVLRSGAAYVPADESSPVSRVAAMARDCQAAAVLTTRDRMGSLAAELGSDVLCHDLEQRPGRGPEPVDETVGPDDLAYILYTSGSTGAPKGVCISHGAARAFVDWVVSELRPTPEDRFSNHAPFTFDLSVLDLYVAFAAGASVHLVPAELAYAPAQLADLLHREGISIWYSVPSALTLMIRDGGLLDRPPPGSLRAVVFAGEPFPIGHVRRLAAWTDARLLNLYGPTETNVCTFHEVRPADLERDRPVPIGMAASGDRVWVERSDGLTARAGEEGELLVAGPTVMLGYWGQERHSGPYRTGDIVKVLPGGSFDYIGRYDHMVKVRGHRVELGEVEAALAAHPHVAEAAAVVVGNGVEARLVALVVLQRGSDPGVLALRRHSAERLPRYMLADEIHLVEALPRTRNGKVDRPDLAEQVTERQVAGPAVG